MEFKNILVPTDGSEYTKTAIKAAVEFAKTVGGKITALYVLDRTMISNMPMDAAVRNVYDALATEGKEAVDVVKHMAEEAGVPVEISVKEGSPVKVILEESPKYDMIIMGTLGRTGMSKLLMGSVAERVVRASSCPVLVVRASEAGN